MRLIVSLLLCGLALLSLRAQDDRLDSIYEACGKCAKKQQPEEAVRLARLYCELCDTAGGSFRLSEMLSCLAADAAKHGDYAAAIRIGTRVVDNRKRVAGCPPRHIANALNDLAVYQSNVGNYDEAVGCAQEALDIYSEHAYKRDLQCASVMANMAAFLCSRGDEGDYKRAVELSEGALGIMKKGTPEYVNVLNNLAVAYSLNNRMSDADKVARTLMKEGRKLYKDDMASYAIMLANHMARLTGVRAYAQALVYAGEAKEAFSQAGIADRLPYAKFLVNSGMIYTALDRYDESLALLAEAEPLLLAIVGPLHEDYVRCLGEMVVVYDKKGDREHVDQYEQKLRSGFGNAGHRGPTDVKSAHVAEKRAEAMASRGNVAQAMVLERTALGIYWDAGNRYAYSAALNKMANFHMRLNNYEAALDSARKAAEILEIIRSKDVLTLDVIGTMAMAHYFKGEHDTAMAYAEKGVELYRQIGDTLGAVYAKALANLALYCFACGDTAKAIARAEQGKNVQEAVLGTGHPDNVPVYYNLARYYNETDADKARQYFHAAMELQTRVVRNNFTHQTTAERETFWNTKSYVYKSAPVLAYIHQNVPGILADAYNAQLFMKGLLLNSEVNFRTFLMQTGDSVLLDNYERLELLHHDIEAAYGLPVSERGNRLAEAEAEAAQLEKQLVAGCKQFGDFMGNLDGDWHQVADALQPGEMAVELMNVYVDGAGDTYMALCLRHGWDAPRAKVLFTQRELEEITIGGKHLMQLLESHEGINQAYSDSRIGQLFWGKLLPELDSVTTLFFAPAGIYYQVAVEYLAIDSTHVVMDDLLACHRVSSTRFVAQRSAESLPYRSATVFGGLLYDMDEAALVAEHQEFKDYVFYRGNDSDENRMLALADEAALIDSLAERGCFSFLPGTLREAETIAETLLQRNVPTNVFLLSQGTEEAFKALDGKRQSILHVATHGFALTDEQVYLNDKLRLLLHDDLEGNPLSRCGLLLSGANYSLQGGRLPEGIENGILTAREISLLDLSGTELVVLSACRTGVGEIRDDGVFGLQRGFKKAGVQSLLMSLWNVSDAGTQEMMTRFYEGLIRGLSKHEALKQAQAAMRSSAAFGAPSYWAAFVILDGE